MNYSATIQLINGWTPQTLKDWLDEGCTCDLTVKAGEMARGAGAERDYYRKHPAGCGGKAQSI